MKLFKIFRYGLMKRFKRGVPLSIILTYACNLRCPYCIVETSQGKKPDVDIKSLHEWKKFINKFPYRIREVLISGGAPELYPGFISLVTWLLGRGLFVQVYTNLTMPKVIECLPKTHRLMFVATYHQVFDKDKFIRNYNRISKNYRVVVDEIDRKVLPFSRLKPFVTNQDMIDNNIMIRVSPNLKMFTNCYDLYKNEN